MSDSNPINKHYINLLKTAEEVIKGPPEVNADDAFWGWPNLKLQYKKMPKIEGRIESRIVYANPCDDEQDRAILRQAFWEADVIRKKLLTAANYDQAFSLVPQSNVSIHSVWINPDWLYQAFNELEKLIVPLKIPTDTPFLQQMYHFRIERSDRTIIEVSWGQGTLGGFEDLSKIWEFLWKQMDNLLQNGEIVLLKDD